MTIAEKRLGSHPSTLGQLPERAARLFGNRTALHTTSGSFDFAEIDRRTTAFAVGLRSIDIRPGDRVVLQLPNGVDWIVAYYAIARIGATVVPANILLVSDEIRFMANDCQAVAVIAPGDRIDALRASPAPSTVTQYIGVGPGCPPRCVRFSDLGSTTADGHPAVDDPIQIATIGYTSGTTGQPKGALLTHRAIVLNTAMTANMHARTLHDTVVSALPCSHVYGNIVMNGAFFCGYTLVLLERFDADAVLSAIDAYRATLFEGVPTMYYYLLGAEGLGGKDLSSLTRCTVGGQTMPLPQMEEVERRLGCPLVELWGMTEIAGLGTTHPVYAPPRLGSIGQALPFNECRIAALDDARRMLPDGESGELMIRGPTVMQGYYGNSAASGETLRADRWMHTGDIAYRDSDGYFYILDRKKEMIITAGYNIYPSELERVIAQHPAVAMVAVGGVPDAAKGELAKAYVVLKANGVVTADELIVHCRRHLAAYKVPKAIQFVRDLPKTSTGKIVRRDLRSLEGVNA